MALVVRVRIAAALMFGVLVSGSGSGVGGHWDVEKYHYKDLQLLGEYAVACHNLQAASQHQLTFQKVITCHHLPGLRHKLTIAAADGGVTHTYQALLFYKPLIQYKKLISFKLL